MSDPSILDGWPEGSSVMVIRQREGVDEVVATAGDLDAARPWASVSKMAVALAFGVEVDWGMHRFDEPAGPPGSTFAHLLSHCSGLGFEAGDPTTGVGVKRVYSNVGIDQVVHQVVGAGDPGEWLADRVFVALGMSSCVLEGRPSAGVVGSTRDLATLAGAWLRPDVVGRATRDRMVTPFLSSLDGVVPGFGRFQPCPWGLGPEVRGTKQHWMGDWPPESFGHFGQSGALLLVNAQEGLGVVATSGAPFGAWASALWPRWTSDLRAGFG